MDEELKDPSEQHEDAPEEKTQPENQPREIRQEADSSEDSKIEENLSRTEPEIFTDSTVLTENVADEAAAVGEEPDDLHTIPLEPETAASNAHSSPTDSEKEPHDAQTTSPVQSRVGAQVPPLAPTGPPGQGQASDQRSEGPSDQAQTQVVHTGPSLVLRRTSGKRQPGPAFPGSPTMPPAPGQPSPPPSRGEFIPRRVEEVDPNATRVTPAAYQSSSERGRLGSPQNVRASSGGTTQVSPAGRPQPDYAQRRPPAQPVPPTYRRSVGVGGAPASTPVPTGRRGRPWKRGLGCLLRVVVAVLFVMIFTVVAAGSWLVFQYFAIASNLPPVDELRMRASQFETTRIYDRNGGVLYEIIDPNAGKRTMVPLERISPLLVAATIATEDREFYNHPGFDPIAIARAFWYNYTSGGIVSGASTITQQLARNLLLSPEERNERTYERKAREIVLAAEITRKYSKDEILELYLNESNYGNLAYGVEAAAETYFGATAANLTLGQAAFLAGLPQTPAVYDIYTNREGTLARQKQVILLMLEDSQLKNCIFVSNSNQPVCVDEMAAIQAVQEMDVYNFQMPTNNLRYPHWVTYIRSLLEQKFDLQDIYRLGLNVYTTLDPALQDQAQAIVTQQVAALVDNNAHNGALVAIRPATGEILAMVGSPDFNDEQYSGQVNMAISPRQPGSSIKPLTYLAAFEKGWTPATLIWDVPTDFPPSGDPNDTRPPYQPVNYDGRFHGPVIVRSALANSYNIPAVKALQFVGIYNEGGLIPLARRLGIETLTRPDYGLSLTLGGGEVTLLDMTSAFSVFANSGKRIPPVAITKIVDFKGNVIFEYQPVTGQQAIRADHAFLINSILSDNNARQPMFGANSVLNLPFPAAAKTGTTNDYRDNWTVGYSPDLAVGVWVGNADYTEMQNVTGISGAAPAWSNFMQFAVPLLNPAPGPFQRPGGVEERVICSLSGAEPSEFCSQQRTEFFAAGQPPLPKEDDLWKRSRLDTWTGLRASAECADFIEEKMTLNVQDPWAITWLKDTEAGRAWADSLGFETPIRFEPLRECRRDDPRPEILFVGLSDGQTVVTSPLDIYVVVKATANFKSFRLEWGRGDNPSEWNRLVDNISNQYANPERIETWDLQEIPPGVVTLRIYLESTENDRFAERRIRLNLNVPTPTPTPTPTSTVTPTPTSTLEPTLTPTPTLAPTQTETPMVTETVDT